jgi:hypothetical protein
LVLNSKQKSCSIAKGGFQPGTGLIKKISLACPETFQVHYTWASQRAR